MKNYVDWKAPKQDRTHLIWPEPRAIVQQTHTNYEQLSNDHRTRICGVPLNRWRASMRSFLGVSSDIPLVTTGHQIEIYHPGVWVKNVLIDLLEKKTGGIAVHFAVDTDTPKHLILKWPGVSRSITDDPELTDTQWLGRVRGPTPEYAARLKQDLETAAANWSFQPVAYRFLDHLIRSCSIPGTMLTECLTRSTLETDQSLGLNYRFHILSELLYTDAYLALVYQIVSDIRAFATQYNRSLEEYRTQAGIRSSTRPMPDLSIAADEIELPFWLDELNTGQRSRARVTVSPAGSILVSPDGDKFVFKSSPGMDSDEPDHLRKFLQEKELRLSPRALTLTMFLRLMVVDQFVHGIGGARYDQVTDRIISGYFGIRPPDFSVTTATLYFPTAQDMSRVCLPCLKMEGHRLRHQLVPDKQTYLQAIESAPRKSLERKKKYLAMHRAIESSNQTFVALEEWKSRFQKALVSREQEEVIFDRELFYGLQSQNRLTSMIDQYRIAFQSLKV
ncbi:MAG: hypothetical protein KatS3mg104_3174 [Phycisphaerae bacterium]|jgi:hypothetical protein|nr:MAG: hypothetical protein KatS3mg104_3174 [Phycisphaerae bacterium]